MPLGIILKNENLIEGMIDILLQLHKYVPIKTLDVIDEKTQCKVADDLVHAIVWWRPGYKKKG